MVAIRDHVPPEPHVHQLAFTGRHLRGVVTDLDGVLTDTETYFLRAIDALLAEEALAHLSLAESLELVGLDNTSLWNRLRMLRDLRLLLDEYTERVDRLARVIFEAEMKPAPGAIQFIQRVKARQIPLGLATSGEASWVEHRLGILGLTGVFDAVLTGDLVANHKPHPEIYLAAAAALGVRPGEVLALEDSPVGVRSAVDAGLYTIAIRTVWTRHLDLSLADERVDSLHEVDLDRFLWPSDAQRFGN